jgi:hypothetical protein
MYRLERVIAKITQIKNEQNRNTVNDFHLFLQESDIRDCHQINLLLTMISFAHCLGSKVVADVRREELKGFLNSKFENGRWVSKIIYTWEMG